MQVPCFKGGHECEWPACPLDCAGRLPRPKRIQRKRMKGWKMPEGAVYVGRGSKWGNPFTWANTGNVHPAVRFACEVAPLLDASPLRGKDLACWCSLNSECHADVLLEIANRA